MKELSKTQFAIFAMGGILMAVGAGCMASGLHGPRLYGAQAGGRYLLAVSARHGAVLRDTSHPSL